MRITLDQETRALLERIARALETLVVLKSAPPPSSKPAVTGPFLGDKG